MSQPVSSLTKKPRGVLIAGNWKMHCNRYETQQFFTKLKALSLSAWSTQNHPIHQGLLRACIIPPFISLEHALKQTSTLGFPMAIAAQNGHWEKMGAFTGETSGPMLKELGIQWVLVGHSERRQYFGETNHTVHLRATSLLEQGFNVILCIGETRQERDKGQAEVILSQQIQEAIGKKKQDFSNFLSNGTLVIAYEPIWAIGTGLTATPQQAEHTHQTIRKLIGTLTDINTSERTCLLYGGSVTPENIDFLLCSPDVDGTLVGGASLNPDQFFALLNSGAQSLL